MRPLLAFVLALGACNVDNQIPLLPAVNDADSVVADSAAAIDAVRAYLSLDPTAPEPELRFLIENPGGWWIIATHRSGDGSSIGVPYRVSKATGEVDEPLRPRSSGL